MSIGEIQELYEYLNFCVKEGYIDEDTAEEYVEKQDWEKVKYLRDMGDYYANEKE